MKFLLEIDRLKSVSRQSEVIGQSRRENSAEHSWHLALCALILGAGLDLDLFKVVRMLLIHDIVEIDVGDMPFHSSDISSIEKHALEIAAGKRIFGLLPEPAAAELMDLWTEFETGSSREAIFARAMDRVQPLLLNLANGGGTWIENDVPEEVVHERYGPVIARGSLEMWEEIRLMLHSHFRKK